MSQYPNDPNNPASAPQQPYGAAPQQPYGAAPQQPPAAAYAQTPYAYGAGAAARPQMGMVQAVKAFFQNYTKFDGRANRSEYWWVVLAWAIIGFVAGVLVGIAGLDATTGGFNGFGMLVYGLLSLFALAALVPSIALSIRRMHDSNKSGWMLLLALIPVVGVLIVLIFQILPSDPAGARFDGAEQPKIGL